MNAMYIPTLLLPILVHVDPIAIVLAVPVYTVNKLQRCVLQLKCTTAIASAMQMSRCLSCRLLCYYSVQ
jgi:hypothetical protein